MPRGSNRSLRIDYWLAEAGVSAGLPWCAAYVSQVGRQALGVAWPVPRSASVNFIVGWAQSNERLELLHDTAEAGDLFVLWNATLARFAHIGFVTEVTGIQFKTIEGNTNPGGSRDGWGVFARSRAFGPGVRFIRWQKLMRSETQLTEPGA